MPSSSSSSPATVTYTSISNDYHMPSWAIPLMDAYEAEPEVPEATPQSPDQAPLLPAYAPVYPEYVAPSNDDLRAEDQPGPVDYLFKEEEDEEPLAPALFASPVPDFVHSSEETGPFEEGETATTPPSHVSLHTIVPLSQTRLRKARKNVHPQTPQPTSIEACIAEYADAPTPPSPPPSPLLPLLYPFPKISSLPLLLPSPTCRDMILEADMLPRKRARFAAPSRKFVVGESSVAAAARQPGFSLARGTELGFMTALEEVKETVILLLPSIGRIARSFIRVTRKLRMTEPYYRLVFLHLRGRGDIIAIWIWLQIRRPHMHDRLGLTSWFVSSNGDDSHDSGSGERRTTHTTRECTYSDFLKCQPLYFKGTEGAVGLSQWTVRHDVAYEMPWKTLTEMMTKNYCPRSEIKKLELNESDKVEKYTGGLPDSIQRSVMAFKPKMLQEAIELTRSLMDQKLLTYDARQAENKRKMDNNSRNNHAQQLPYKRLNVACACAYADGPGEKREYDGTLPLCNKCKFHHNGSCTAKCINCKRVGQFKRDCPKLKNQNRVNSDGNSEACGRAYALRGGEPNPNSNVVTGYSEKTNVITAEKISVLTHGFWCIIPTTWGKRCKKRDDKRGVTLKQNLDILEMQAHLLRVEEQRTEQSLLFLNSTITSLPFLFVTIGLAVGPTSLPVEMIVAGGSEMIVSDSTITSESLLILSAAASPSLILLPLIGALSLDCLAVLPSLSSNT
nr:hypothetical protein [Tanacetum cinerariifolium]